MYIIVMSLNRKLYASFKSDIVLCNSNRSHFNNLYLETKFQHKSFVLM